MTCVVGLLDKGDVWMGADGATSNGWITHQSCYKKMYRRDAALFGVSGSWRGSQLMQYALRIPKRDVGESLEKYMYIDFINALRGCFEDGGHTKKEDGVETVGTNALIAYAGRLFRLDSDLHLGESLDDFDAVGSGYQVALGSLATSIGRPPRERVMLALKAAARFISTVGPPFNVMCLRGTAAKGR